MIAERMEESLVLLAHRLCLPLYRMASFRQNVRRDEEKLSLTRAEREELLRLQRVDWEVYRHFAKKFQEEVESFGLEKMRESVQELRRINSHVIAAHLHTNQSSSA